MSVVPDGWISSQDPKTITTLSPQFKGKDDKSRPVTPMWPQDFVRAPYIALRSVYPFDELCNTEYKLKRRH